MFISPIKYFAGVMGRRLGVPPERIRVVYNGINLKGYAPKRIASDAPVIGFFARMCREKGLDLLVDAYIELRKQDRFKKVQLRIGGSCGPNDEPFVESLKDLLRKTGLLESVEFRPNLTRSQKLEFLESLSLFSVPARYSEAFGLYVIEAMAAGVPVVQPRSGAFTEIVRQVEFSETDMAGIVHYSNFFRYMEAAEDAFFRSLGFSVVTSQVDPPVGWPRVHAECDYREPLRFEDEIEVHMSVTEKRSK